jgi:type I restriction-modification system DNA methylase subunit
MPKRGANSGTNRGRANLGFEAKLWAAADALRNNMDAAEYKHVVLGLIFLYLSDAFEAKHSQLEAQKHQGADPEDPNEYRACGSLQVVVFLLHTGCQSVSKQWARFGTYFRIRVVRITFG